MRLVVDANVVISALIADSVTRRLVLTLEADLLTPAVVHREIEAHEDRIVDRSGLDPALVHALLERLFASIETVPSAAFAKQLEPAREALGDVDPDDVPYLACALGTDAAIWSDDRDFEDQDLVPVYRSSAVLESFGNG